MTHLVEIITNVVNVGASIGIVGLLVWLAGQLRTQGKDVVVSRLVLQQRETSLVVAILLLGLLVFIGSNVLELIGDILHLDWVVNEIVETIALFVMLVGLIGVAAILRIPVQVRNALQRGIVRVEPP